MFVLWPYLYWPMQAMVSRSRGCNNWARLYYVWYTCRHVVHVSFNIVLKGSRESEHIPTHWAILRNSLQKTLSNATVMHVQYCICMTVAFDRVINNKTLDRKHNTPLINLLLQLLTGLGMYIVQDRLTIIICTRALKTTTPPTLHLQPSAQIRRDL